VATLKTGKGSDALIFDATRRLLGPPKPPEPWPSVVPGTFAFLVVSTG
jgi:hypothetical protein